MIERAPDRTADVTLHDGSTVMIEIHGDGPALLLPVNPRPITGEQADVLRQYGADPALGQSLIQGLCDAFRVIAFDYEGHLRRTPRPHTLTPDAIVSDLLAVADAARANRFAYYGYSWLAMIGLQLALRTDRLWALVMGGYPPLDAPYAEMRQVTAAAYEIAGSEVPADEEWSAAELSKEETQQYVTLYEALRDFDDRAAQQRVTCPRVCFVGGADEIYYGPSWGDVTVSLAGPVIRGEADLTALGWDVHILHGLDHMQALQAAQVLPILQPFLEAHRPAE
jgi:pimeloyl-ACP methyl ester carboxylesterase